MLTAEIKSKIDSARNILVGKIPTPTGQVEQITLALVYKFMNDIDEQNKELGGELKFFTGEYSKYAWKHLLDKGLSAYERVTAYGEDWKRCISTLTFRNSSAMYSKEPFSLSAILKC